MNIRKLPRLFSLLLIFLLAVAANAQTKLQASPWRYLAPGDSIWAEISLLPGDRLEWGLVLSRLTNGGETKLVFESDVEGILWEREFDAAAVEANDDIRIKKTAKYRLTLYGDDNSGRAIQLSAWPRIGKDYRDPFPKPGVQRVALSAAQSDKITVEYEFLLPRTTSFNELMELELADDLVQAWAITPEGDSLVLASTVKRWLGDPGKMSLRERGGSRGGRISLIKEFEMPVAGETILYLAPGSDPPDWLPGEARVLMQHLHAPWHAALVPPLVDVKAAELNSEPPIAQSKYAAQSLRIRGIDSTTVQFLTQVYVGRDSLNFERRDRLETVEGYDSEFLQTDNAFLPPELHATFMQPLSQSGTVQERVPAKTVRWFVNQPAGEEPEGTIYLWKFDEGLAAIPEAEDEIFWYPDFLPLSPDLTTFGAARAEFAEDARMSAVTDLRPAKQETPGGVLFDHSRRIFGLYLENASTDTLLLVYRDEAPLERSMATTISRWPRAARIAIIVLLIVGLIGIYALYELRQRERRRRVHAEEIAQDLEKARQVQEKLLPTGPMDVKGLEVLGLHQSMQSVGGDYYDFFPLKDGRVLICVADVAGHGLAAAMLMSNLQATLHAIAESPRPVNELVKMLNQEITKRTSPERFVTLLLAEISADRTQLTICNAGHNPGYLVRKNGKVEELDAGGIMLGVMDLFPYIQMDYGLEPGDVIALYTDGIPEAEIGFEDMFGYERLQYFLSEHRDQKLQDVAQKLFRKVSSQDASKIDDDMAIVLVRVKLK